MRKNKNRIKTFLSDGLDAREFLMLTLVGTFVFLVISATVQIYKGKPIDGFLELIKSMDGILMIVVGGFMGIGAVSVAVNGRKQDLKYKNNEQANIQQSLANDYIYDEYQENIYAKPIQGDYAEDSYINDTNKPTI